MKHSTQQLTWLVLLAVVAFGQPLRALSQKLSGDEGDTSAPVQNVETVKWRFGGNDAGTSIYQTFPDGKFESVTELSILGMALKSRLSGKLADGAITEFEIVNQQAGTEVKVSAKDGKARITAQGKTREVEYKPSKVLFANLHPALTETLFKALDPVKEGLQNIEVFVLDAAALVKVGVLKKKAHTFELAGEKRVADVYLVRFPGVEFDVHLAQGSRFAALDIPSQKLQAIRSGYEGLLVDPTTLYPELSQP